MTPALAVLPGTGDAERWEVSPVALAMALVADAEAIARLEAAADTPHLPVVALARRMRVHALLVLGGHLADPGDAA